ncbi:3D domain-containing protein [Risungbinella massiliensis]|uniref:3D domain-containing protein n=1 Tax=Risungbinella massiliensis TaxID=1329796 RepID=UPI00069C2A95|nr:3D domain-containing protein [Risungbinella massiliensis]
MKPYQWVFCTFSMLFFLFAYGWQTDSFSGTHAEVNNTNKVQTVTVQKGDTLYELSKKYGVSLEAMVTENQIKDPAKIQIGQKLKVPALNTTSKSSKSQPNTNDESSTNIQSKQNKSTQQIPSINRGKNLGLFTITALSVGDSSANKSGLIIPGVTVGVDPQVIPVGSRIYIESVGYRIAQDVGGAIKGKQITLFFANEADAKEFGGRQDVRVEVLED